MIQQLLIEIIYIKIIFILQKKAIDFIKQTEECFILIGDFTSFFDSLDHGYLKKDALQFIECKQITE